MLHFSAINLSQLHKSANTNCWWELCKQDTCNGESGGSLPFVHLLVLLVCFFKAVSELLHLPSTCDFSQHYQQPLGAYYFVPYKTSVVDFQMYVVLGFCT